MLLALALAYVKNDHSSYFTMVERDGSWLGYLPADGTLEINVGGLNLEQSPQGEIRRVDLMDAERDQVVSLCFASSKRLYKLGARGFGSWAGRIASWANSGTIRTGDDPDQ